MATLTESAKRAAADTLSLVDAAIEHGDVAQTVIDALLGGHILFLLADASHTALAEQLAAVLRRRSPAEPWPPVLTITANTPPLALIGCEYGVANPLSQQAEILIREGDVVLVLAGSCPSADLLHTVGLATSHGAVVVGLGLPPSSLKLRIGVSVPDAPAEHLIECQLVLGDALVEALARQLPAEQPPEMEPALIRFGCTNCNADLAIPRHIRGRRGVCPHCYNNTVLAPGIEAAQNEKRAHMRFSLRECSLRVSLAPGDKAPIQLPGQVALENLSAGGLLLSIADSPVEVRLNDTLLVELTTPAFQRPLSLRGSVRRVTREANLSHVAIAFHEVPPSTFERLRILEHNLVLRHATSRAPRPAEEEDRGTDHKATPEP